MGTIHHKSKPRSLSRIESSLFKNAILDYMKSSGKNYITIASECACDCNILYKFILLDGPMYRVISDKIINQYGLTV